MNREERLPLRLQGVVHTMTVHELVGAHHWEAKVELHPEPHALLTALRGGA